MSVISSHTRVRCGRGKSSCTKCGTNTYNSKTGYCRICYKIEYEKFRDEGGISNVLGAALPKADMVTTVDVSGRIHGYVPLTFRLNLGEKY